MVLATVRMPNCAIFSFFLVRNLFMRLFYCRWGPIYGRERERHISWAESLIYVRWVSREVANLNVGVSETFRVSISQTGHGNGALHTSLITQHTPVKRYAPCATFHISTAKDLDNSDLEVYNSPLSGGSNFSALRTPPKNIPHGAH